MGSAPKTSSSFIIATSHYYEHDDGPITWKNTQGPGTQGPGTQHFTEHLEAPRKPVTEVDLSATGEAKQEAEAEAEAGGPGPEVNPANDDPAQTKRDVKEMKELMGKLGDPPKRMDQAVDAERGHEGR